MKAPGSAVGESEPPPGCADTNEPDLCVCGAQIVAEVIPTLQEIRARLVVLERRMDALDHVHVFVFGRDRCSTCGAPR